MPKLIADWMAFSRSINVRAPLSSCFAFCCDIGIVAVKTSELQGTIEVLNFTLL
jgi:hypothetical protein